MSYKPDESTLIAYLYNELDSKERVAVEEYLKANPEMKKELDELKTTRELLGKFQDTEVEEPTFVFNPTNSVLVPSKNAIAGYVQVLLAVAACITILMLVGYFTQFNVTMDETGLRMGYGVKEMPAEQESLSREAIQALVDASLKQNNEEVLGKINEVESGLNASLSANEEALRKTNRQMNQLNSIDEAIIQNYVAQLKRENTEIILGLVESSESTQRAYFNEVLADFSLYLEEQRQSDLQMIETSFNLLKDDTQINQLETNQLLASIITTVKNQNN